MKVQLLNLIIAILTTQMAFAQKGGIRGMIKTADGQPAAFVNVGLKGYNKSAAADGEGKYELKNVDPGNYTLITFFVGFESKEQSISVKAGEVTMAAEIILKENLKQLQEVVVSSRRVGESRYASKMPLKNIENMQVYNTVSSEIMKQQVITNFDDALNNAPGISRLWESTGRAGDGAAYYSLRGFETQATMVNGLPGLTNGSLDPANIEQIEVIKGPSGTLYGSSLISYGGLINTVTKTPYQSFGGEVNYITGSFGLNRVTADVNAPLDKEQKLAVRINTAYHTENSFQDAGFKKSFFVAPSLLYKENEKLSFLVNMELIQEEKTNPVMLFLNRSNPLQYKNIKELSYDKNLSLTSNDLSIKNPRYNLQAQMNYKIAEQWNSQTVLSRGLAISNGYYSYLWDTWIDKGEFSLFISDQQAQITTMDIQQNFVGDFKIRNCRNRMVIGVDYFERHTTDNSTGYEWLHDVTPQGEINYVNPYTGDTVAPQYLSHQSVDAVLKASERSNSNVKDATWSAYISDVMNITPKFLAMASIRVDYFDTQGDVKVKKDDYNQATLSPKFGLLYQPVKDRLSVFANYMNGFKNMAPVLVSDVDGSNPRIKTFRPEHANQLELGIKTNLAADKLTGTFSYYAINVENVVIGDAKNINNSIQGGKVESKGYELDINANPLEGLNIIAGYSHNDSKIIKGDAANVWFEQGKRPIASGPQQSFNIWGVYKFTKGAIKGFGIGCGANYASELPVLNSDVTGKFILPAYTIYNASLLYNTGGFRITAGVSNFTNVEYYKGYSTINPQKPRNVSVSFSYLF